MAKVSPNQQLLTLPLDGPARLNYRGQAIKLRRKGLALLYYLALEGPTRREQLAALLWDNRQAMNNLRVELHRLKQAWPCGAPFAAGEDPLRLPDDLALERGGAGACLDGLDDISPEFQDWLEYQRARQAGHHQTPLHATLLDEVSRMLDPPAVLVLRGPPGSGLKEFAQALARRLELPLSEGLNGVAHQALRYVPLPCPDDALLLSRILEHRTAVWVVAGSSFGEEPRLVLQLRQALPARQVRYLHLPPLSWPEVRRTLRDLPFQEAAALYLQAAGNRMYLDELLNMRAQFGQQPLPVPQRVRAAFAVEARHLTYDARLALERLCVHPGPLPLYLIRALGAEAHLDELERRGWLVFENGAWQLDEPQHTLLYEGLQPGRRARYHELAAEAVAHLPGGQELQGAAKRQAEAYHRRRSDGLGASAQAAVAATVTLEPGCAVQRRLGLGQELMLLDPVLTGPGVSFEQGRIVWSGRRYGSPPARINWQLEPGCYLLRLRGRAYLADAFSLEESYPLRLELPGTDVPPVILAPRLLPCPDGVAMGELPLPLHSQFDCWLAFAAGPALQLSSAATRAIIEADVRLYALEPAPTHHYAIVPAYQLSELEVKDDLVPLRGHVPLWAGLLGRLAEGEQLLVISCCLFVSRACWTS